MQDYSYNNGRTDCYFGATRNGLLLAFKSICQRLFGKKTTETFCENYVETDWERKYKEIQKINFAEIFGNRLTNLSLADSSVYIEDETLQDALGRCTDKWYKWVQMAFGIGRAFLIPYIINGKIYTDIIPQSRAWATALQGDDVIGIGVLADIRTHGEKRYARLANYKWNPDTKEFLIENKAINMGTNGGAEIPLSSVEEWTTIPPKMIISNTERPLFAYIDCPKDNRTTDRLQGAPITFGCEATIKEIYDCIMQYREEYELKRPWLGIDEALMGKDNRELDPRLFKKLYGKSTENLFEIFSPDIRSEAYKARLMELFRRLEVQVGTSAGILTPMDSANATATQVRRAMYDTISIVNRMRKSISVAIHDLVYIYSVYFGMMGIYTDPEANIVENWSNKFVEDRVEQFSMLMQAEQAGVVKESEIRQYLFPNESVEDSERIVEKIKESKPEPAIPDFFGA